MNASVAKIFFPFLAVYILLALGLSGAGNTQFSNLHIALDASTATLSGMFAALLASSAILRRNAPYRPYLAVAFVLVSLSEALHALIGAEWTGSLAWITASSQILRPATWPPSTYFLPIAMLLALPAANRRTSLPAFTAGLLAVLASLYALFLNVPSYLDTGILGISRPFQLPLLPLLATVAVVYWRRRHLDPIFCCLITCTALLFLSDLAMLWSVSPHEKWTMIAHVGKLLAYIAAHGAMVRLSIEDMHARNQAEADLQANVLSLQASEQRFRQLLESAPDTIFVSNANGVILMANRQAEIMFGYTKAELIGQSIDMLVPPRSRKRHVEQRQKYESAPLPAMLQNRRDVTAIGKDGREFPMEISLSPLETEQGRIFVSAIRDTSERQAMERELDIYRSHLESVVEIRTRELAASEARFRNLVEQSLVGIYIIEGAYFSYVNQAFADIFAYPSPADIIGVVPVADFVAPEDRAMVAENVRRRVNGETSAMRYGFTGLTRDGHYIDVEVHGSGVRIDGRQAVIGQALDVSARKAAEKGLQHLNTELELRVQERTAELTAVNQELQAFTYAASHDLKAPLRAINSFSGLLERRYRDRLEGEGLEFLEFIRSGASRMNMLIDDLLAYARIDQSNRTTEPVDLGAAIERAISEQRDEIRAKGAQVRCDLPPVTLVANPSGLAQVLRNLLENALKYCKPDVCPLIEISGRTQGRVFIVQVRDNGIGFDMAHHDRIFRIFQRLHGYEQYQGSGVGLALVKKAMERMGGQVWADSTPGEGSVFFLQMPVAEQTEAATAD